MKWVLGLFHAMPTVLTSPFVPLLLIVIARTAVCMIKYASVVAWINVLVV